MAEGLAASRERREQRRDTLLQELAVFFARRAGVEPALDRWPQLERALLFGPLSPVSFRLQGPDRLEDAPARVAEAAALFGAIRSPDFTPEELQLRAMIMAPAAAVAA